MLNVAKSPPMVVNTTVERSEMSIAVSLFNSLISRDNSVEVYPDKSLMFVLMLLLIILVVSFDKSTMVEEIELFKAFKLASIDASILIDCGLSVGSDDNTM